MTEQKQPTDEFDKLIDTIGERLMGEPLDAVIPALTTLLANAGVMSGVSYSTFVSFVLDTVAQIYKRHDDAIKNETFH